MTRSIANAGAPKLGRRLAIAFFIAAALLSHAQVSTWNVTSRMAAIESLVDRHTFAIDGSPFVTGDKYRYRGHFYSDKPPVLAVAGAAVGLVARAARVDIARSKFVLLAVTIVLVAAPFALGIGALFGLLRKIGIGPEAAAAATTIAGSATLAFPFATVLLNHVPAAALLIGALALLARGRCEGDLGAVAVAGAALALSIGIDTSYAIFFVLAPIVLGRTTPRAYLAYLGGAAPILGALAATNLALSGNLQPPDTNAPLFDWPGSQFGRGNLAGTVVHRDLGATLRYGFNVLLGVRGLFLYSPILVLGLYALVRRLREQHDPAASLYRFIALATAAYVASAIVATIDYGGDAYGMRTFVGIEWLLCVPLGAYLADLRANQKSRVPFLAVLAVSIAFAMLGVNDPFSYRPFPLLDGLPGLIRFTHAHRAHGLLESAALAIVGTLAFAFVARTLAPRRAAAAHVRAMSPRASSRASRR